MCHTIPVRSDKGIGTYVLYKHFAEIHYLSFLTTLIYHTTRAKSNLDKQHQKDEQQELI